MNIELPTIITSIHPEYCQLILSGKKIIEVRKTIPKKVPFRSLIYCTKSPFELARDKKGNIILLNRNKTADISDLEILSGKVIGEFVCMKADRITHCGTRNDDIRLRIVEEGLHYKELDYEYVNNRCCLSITDLEKYAAGSDIYGWHISDLKIYDEPKELSKFYKSGMLSYDDWLYGIYNGHGGATSSYESYKNVFKLTRPPQSWCYVEELVLCRRIGVINNAKIY